MASFVKMNLNNNIDSLTYANHLCNAYGFDTISAGATVSFAIECYENGILTREDTDGLELRWGDDKAVIALLNKMGNREGIGDVLADGVKKAAERIGRGSEKYAMHVAGEELPMHDPKLQPEYHTTYKLDPTPARHTQYEGNRRFGLVPPAVRDRTVAEGRGAHHKGASEYMHVVNSAGHCQFVMMAANTANIPQWINMTTGWDVTREELLETGERIANMRMAFEVREGGNPAKRAVPERMSGPVLKEGPHANFGLDTKTLEKEFLEACDWDPETTKPSAAKLRSLGLEDVVPMIHA
jgi:aldehyde:ferredoxin oxidoreductase